jgi:hypothetical protein
MLRMFSLCRVAAVYIPEHSARTPLELAEM